MGSTYRIRIDLAFYDNDPIDDIYDKVIERFTEAHTINPGQPDQERGFCIVEECMHEETPSVPCNILYEHYTPD